MQSKNILLFQEITPAYRVAIFRELYKRYGIILCHSLPDKTSTVESSFNELDFPNEIVPIFKTIGKSQKIIHVLRKYKPSIIILSISISNLTFLKAIFLKPFFNYKIIAWGHGVNNKEINRPLSGFRGKVMQWYFYKSDALLFYSNARKEIVEKKIPHLKSKIFVAWNTLDTLNLKKYFQKLTETGKTQVKNELGLTFKRQLNIIYIGRLLTNKRIDLILNAFDLLVNKLDVSLHFIGKGQMESTIEQHPLYKKNIYTYGAIYDDERTSKFLFASDLFLMPGYVGLSVVHSFAMGIPVLTCKMNEIGPYHSPEFEYIKDGENGILTGSSPNEISDALYEYLNNDNKQQLMKRSAINTAYNDCSIDLMMQGFYDAITFVSLKE